MTHPDPSIAAAAPELTRKQRKRLSRQRRRRLTDRKYHQDPCAYCQETSATVDHIHARRWGGPDAPMNKTGACRRCNTLKGDTPALLFLLQHGGYPLQGGVR